ncbi:hypothetical protein M5X17_20660 [Paenibacillus alvei]|uniref:hypothetical protein n=1 Tax=Paenibacillus alvei TaxID=44250 RepID=UPI00227EA77B|nr:hypothetical protein [Paenibacillus alvei]MCY9543613.1 hypothetical protein [Paenibacillus alvei]MCY9736132.1 hypothetical protein [Paenibacillus alvei]MEC0084361.1 hypothetical protein [Paenibacillus alvei]
MEKFDFIENDRVTFFWRFSNEKLTGVKATVKEIEDTGVWFEFDGEEDESFVTYGEMHLFIREGSTTPEGTHALSVNQLTAAHFGNVDQAAMVKLIESLT